MLKDWTDDNMGTMYDGVDFYVLQAQLIVNFAVVYQVTQQASYGRAAIDKMLYLWDNPYSTFTTETWIEGNDWYAVRYLVPGSALVFDWCYDQLTTQERDRFVGQLDTWARKITTEITPSNWAWEASESNYWYGYLWALTSTAYALLEHAGSAVGYIDYVTGTMVPEALSQVNGEPLAWPTSVGQHPLGGSKGGEWSEGNDYGSVNTDFLVSTLFAMKSAEGRNRFADTSFFAEHVLTLIHAKPPAGDFFVVAGDGEPFSLSTSGVFPVPIAMAIAASLEGDPTSPPARFGQYWLNEYSSLYPDAYKLFNWFIWYDPSGEQVEFAAGNLEADHFAEGMRIQMSRTDWTDSALWFYARFNPHYADHTFDGQGGHFSLWKNGWLIKDNATGKYPARDPDHNVVYLPPDADDPNGMWWDAPTILHRELTADYVYYAADVTPVFSGPEVRCDWRACNVELNQRTLFFLREGYLVIYDRIQTEAASDTKAWQVFFASTPTETGGIFSLENSGSKIFLKTLLPEATSYALASSGGSERLRVTTNDAQYVAFLNVMEVKDGAPATMTPTVQVSSADGNMVGAAMGDSILVLFSEDGSEVSSVTYALAGSGTTRHYITGLAPEASYSVTGPGQNGVLPSSGDGVVVFTTDGSGDVVLQQN
jgi:hypothetical protein